MTKEEIIEVLIIERTCVERQDTPSCDRDCLKCDLALPRDRVVHAYEQAIDILHEDCVGSTQKCVGNALDMRCDDAISRDAVLKIIDGWYDNNREVENIEDLIILITYMQAVQPKKTQMIDKSNFDVEQYKVDLDTAYECGKASERQTGKWIDYSDEGFVECPFCEHATSCEDNIDELHYCFFCGAYMFEPQESE